MSTIRRRLWQQYQDAAQSVWELPPAGQNIEGTVPLPPVSPLEQTRRNRTVLVHGYKDEASVFNPLASYLTDLGLEPHAVTLAPSDCSVPLESLAQQLAEFVDRNFLSYQKLDFVGFSLGGIVARYYIQRLGGLARTNRLLTVAAPHFGTMMAYASALPGAMQLRPNSKFLSDLNADAESLASIPFVSLWSPFDLMILPPFNSRIPAARNIAVWTLRHQALITSQRGIQKIAEQLLAQGQALPSPTFPDLAGRPSISRRTAGEGFELQRQS